MNVPKPAQQIPNYAALVAPAIAARITSKRTVIAQPIAPRIINQTVRPQISITTNPPKKTVVSIHPSSSRNISQALSQSVAPKTRSRPVTVQQPVKRHLAKEQAQTRIYLARQHTILRPAPAQRHSHPTVQTASHSRVHSGGNVTTSGGGAVTTGGGIAVVTTDRGYYDHNAWSGRDIGSDNSCSGGSGGGYSTGGGESRGYSGKGCR